MDNRENPRSLGTLAVACAQAGDFNKAYMLQKESIAICDDPKTTVATAICNDSKTIEDFNSRLSMYQSQKPYVDYAQ